MCGREYAVATPEKFSTANVKGLDDIMSNVVATSAATQEAVNALRRVGAVTVVHGHREADAWSIVSYYYHHMMMYSLY
jgi:hypothetical protein